MPLSFLSGLRHKLSGLGTLRGGGGGSGPVTGDGYLLEDGSGFYLTEAGFFYLME